jgi:hypothetical protein
LFIKKYFSNPFAEIHRQKPLAYYQSTDVCPDNLPLVRQGSCKGGLMETTDITTTEIQDDATTNKTVKEVRWY